MGNKLKEGGNKEMNADDFEDVQIVEDVECDSCHYQIIEGSIAHQNFTDNLIYCSTCWDKLRRV